MPARPSKATFRDKRGLVFAAVVSLQFCSQVHNALHHLGVYAPFLRNESSSPVHEASLIPQIRREVAGDHRAQNGAKIRRALDAEAIFKARLRLHPGLAPGLQALFPGFGQMQLLGAAVGRGCFDLDQAVRSSG